MVVSRGSTFRNSVSELDLATDIVSTARLCRPAWGGISLAVVVFALLWILNAPYRQVYQPGHDDVTALADGSLLLPQAHWWAWFTRGHSDFFDTYPEWAQHDTAFARPVFQFVIYLAHFLFGVDWSSYLVNGPVASDAFMERIEDLPV